MKYFLLILSVFVLISCTGDEQKSDAYGSFEATEILVSSEVAGQLLQLNVDQGQKVSKGQIIAQVDTTTIALQMRQLYARKKAVLAQKKGLQAQTDITTQQIKNLKIDLSRVKNMYKDGAATKKQIDDIEGQLQVLKKQISAHQVQASTIDSQADEINANIALSHKRLNDCTILAPSKGTILAKYIEQGELTKPGTALVKLSDLSTLELRVFVSGKQLQDVKIGSKVELLSDSKDGMYKDTGSVTWVSPKAEFTPKVIQTRDERVDMVYAVKIAVKNDDGRYKIGMPGEVNFNNK